MVTDEERNEIINAAVERTLLAIPEVVGNLMANHAALHKINSAFYKKYPEFSGRKDIVQSVVEMIEGKNPTMEYEKMLELAVPEIRKRLIIVKDVDVKGSPKEMKKDFSGTDFSGNNGAL
jgi:hypothetical protein